MRQTNKQMEKKGWLRQLIVNEIQAKDTIEIYNLLGYEVYLQTPNRARDRRSNASSLQGSQGKCQILYIRPKKSQDDGEV